MARRLAHVSDLHFGRSDPALVEPLLLALSECAPDLIVVTGDLTQRATREEFACARAMLSRLEAPALVVPGNHDVPLWNAALRFFAPRRRFCRELGLPWISTWSDAELVVVGLDTPRPWRAKQGAISRDQVEHVRRAMEDLPHEVVRIVALHHPLALPRRMKVGTPHVLGAKSAALAMRDFGVDVVLAGHLHVSGLHQVVDTQRDGLLHVLAPSAISTRLRGEVNGFNVLDVDGRELTTTLHSWHHASGRFVPQQSETHVAGARAS